MDKRYPLIAGLILLIAASGMAWAQDQPAAPAASTMTGSPSELVQAAGTGVASKYWLRFMADSTPTLWLFIDNGWRRMDKPSAAVTEAVQEVFCGCSNQLEVYAGYTDSTLSWVVVRSK